MNPILKTVIVILAFAAATFFQLEKSLAQGYQKMPVGIQRLLINVRKAMDKNDYAAAVKLIQADQAKSKSNTPCSHPTVCLALGNCFLMQKEMPHAESAYLTALSLDKNYLDAQVNLAKIYTDTNRTAKAVKAFWAAYQLSDPKNPKYLYYSAVMALTDGKTQTAIRRFDSLFSAHPDQVTRQWRENYANALVTAQQWKKAAPVLRDLIAQSKGESRIKWQEALLQIYLTINDTGKALDLAGTLSRQAPSEARWWKALVHIHLTRGEYANAFEDLIIYSFVTPLTRQEKKLFADLSLQLNIPAQAARMYETLITESAGKKSSPSHNRQMINGLVCAYRQMGRGDKALAVLNRLDPQAGNPELLRLKGDVLYETKNYKAADKAFRTAALKNCSQKGQAWLMAGYAAWQYNDIVASRSAFKQAAQYKHQREDALAAIAQLNRSTQM
ncbi:tetratricopeptide repeat protein [Desulfobacter postgatei]|jgi:Tfp pilus assembly protein PilF|uniref:tetratricopeptide repeat protein n=1 Tax=Desulfobacter postgatei TaxID=2293 RepID=UPI002A36EBF8|nr:tetratricopeptide repeat protein [Desulfobacter postgatei]MDX9963226.1 tetratricopeptide repeat protein [Desulfobacter postgatei]